jgi:hypothetical protein
MGSRQACLEPLSLPSRTGTSGSGAGDAGVAGAAGGFDASRWRRSGRSPSSLLSVIHPVAYIVDNNLYI